MNLIAQFLRYFHRNRLTDPQKALLYAMVSGWTLKSHRTLDGQKVYRLHALSGEVIQVADGVVDGLATAKLLQSNQKFPAATYLITEKGHLSILRFTESDRQIDPQRANIHH